MTIISEARQTFIEGLQRLQTDYNIHEGNGTDTDRKRITCLICDLFLELEPEVTRALTGRGEHFLVVGYLNAGLEKAIYDALQEYSFECGPTPYETSWQAINTRARTEKEKRELRALKYNPLKLHLDNGHQPIRSYAKAATAFPVIDIIIRTLLGQEILKEEKTDARERSEKDLVGASVGIGAVTSLEWDSEDGEGWL